MEKFSAFRDPGTGIQPFLAPVPQQENDFLVTLLMPVRVILAVLRTVVVIVLALVHIVIVHVVGSLCRPLPPLQDLVLWSGTSLLARLTLYVVGFWWIPTEFVIRKKGKCPEKKWSPRAGDLIVSNWSSWIEILWLAYQYNPIFVLPIANAPTIHSSAKDASPISYVPGRRTGTGSAAISPVSRISSSPETIRGFRQVSLLEMIFSTGSAPSAPSSVLVRSLEDIRRSVRRPVVVFPECTTSNSRSLLRFANVFSSTSVPVKGYNVFLMCVRYDPPTPWQPSLTHSIPETTLNPLRHLFKISSSLPPQTITIRQLPLSESPSSQLFIVSEVVSELHSDVLAEACAVLIARMGKMKRVGFGWEDKYAFLDFYRRKR